MGRWLVLLVLVCWTSACPEDCSCLHEQGLYKAVCSSLPNVGAKLEALQVLPDNLPETPPLELIDGQFNSARHLKHLNLSQNSVFFIHKKAFYGARSLVEIDLSFNFIEELEPTVFQHLGKLKTLILRGNPIQIVPEVPFLISNSIQQLDIGECKLKSIPRGVFYGLKHLRYLSLDGNLIKTVKYNSLPKGLTYINLAQNHIVNVPTEVFTSLTNLRRVGLGGNPINCSCSLLNMQDWLSGRGVVFEGNVTCDLPVEYSGINWSKIDENKLCLIEARREEISQSTVYNQVFKNKQVKNYYFENEKSSSDENLQSDQPQPDTQVEVMFSNDETQAMGEMMRDEEFKSNVNSSNLENISSSLTREEVEHPTPITETRDVEEMENHDSTNSIAEEEDLTDKSNVLLSKTDEPEKVTRQSDAETNSQVEHETTEDSDHSAKINDIKSVEYKKLSEDDDSNKESDVFKNEGLLMSNSQHVPVSNITSDVLEMEDSTIMPDLEDTTENENFSTDEPLVDNEQPVEVDNVTSTSETYSSVNVSDIEVTPEITSQSPVTEVYLSTSSVGLLAAGVSYKSSEDSSRTQVPEDPNRKGAGAEVVMFCIAVLIICLVLFAIYKCRNSTSRPNKNVKDLEANRCTELQDMASLLPKPQEENEKKLNSKYSDKDKALPSETMKLIPEQGEPEPAESTAVLDPKSKSDENNLLNNNTSNKTNQTPSLKPKNQLNVNQPEPIQRAKAKVGILPDSIPKTPIFLQKTYNNGTKKV